MNNIIFPHPPPHGGPGTFQQYLEAYLKDELGYEINYAQDSKNKKPDLIFVNLGTRKLVWLLIQKLKGTPIIQRLDGVNWRHRFEKKQFSKYYFRSVLTNILVALIRKYLADIVIYQSKFIKQDWDDKYGKIKTDEVIIYNATDLSKYYPQEMSDNPNLREIKIVGVEGNIQFDEFTAATLKNLDTYLKKNNHDYVIDLYGGYENRLEEFIKEEKLNISLKGKVTRGKIAQVIRNYDIYFTLELFPPCPNSVIEALASGLAITGYNSGSLKELVGDNSGMLIELNTLKNLPNSEPDYSDFEYAMTKLLNDYKSMKKNARDRALKKFDKKDMLREYISVIQKKIG